MPDALQGEAAEMGRTVANAMRAHESTPGILVWGGETIVTIVGDSGVGGRSQELALAAKAERLQGSGDVLLRRRN